MRRGRRRSQASVGRAADRAAVGGLPWTSRRKRAHRTVLAPNGWTLTPEARGRVSYDVLDDRRRYTARFVTDPSATPFAVTGLQPQRTALTLGAGLNTRLPSIWRASLSYDAELRGGDTGHLLSGGLKANW